MNLCIGGWAAATPGTRSAPTLGVTAAVAAIDASFADVINASFRRRILPT